MSKKIEKIVEEFQNKDHIITSDGGLYVAVDAHWLRTTLTTYGNARELEGVEKVEKGVPEAIYLPVESTENDHLKAVGSNLLRKAVLEHIATIKSELK
jgi:hypothetical protein